MNHLKAYVSNIQRFSVHDGQGIRTTIFLLGCPLRCKWCQNPETLNSKPVIMMNQGLCAECGACMNACPQRAISLDEQGIMITDNQQCNYCFECTAACYFNARQVSGRQYTSDELFHDVIKDKEFYLSSGGGVTISGGEPTMHTDYCCQLFKMLKEQGIHAAIETCGYTKWESFERLIPVADLFLYDIKLFDENKHKKWTGVSNELILENLIKLDQANQNIIIRIPLIPTVNDDEAEFMKIIGFVKKLQAVEEVHILPFHQLGSSKYKLVGKLYDLEDLPEENNDRVEKCKNIALDAGFRVSIGGAGFKKR